ncbi:AEC family transporter [Oceanispirochaeta crateris]|uniref:AEC family transporter n=1 Tax=Oceanispirochaeta crateris TaxID=2518645 RepID=UPI00143CE6A9|nr:AEC family transporter [Oceanispirochaeta crateris]
MSDLIPALVALFLPIFLGLLCRNGNFIDPSHRIYIQQFAVRVTIPFMVFNSLIVMDLKTAGQFLPMSLGFFLFLGIVWLISWGILTFLAPKSRWVNKYKAELFMLAISGNIGYICWKLHELLIGADGLQRGIFYTSFFWPILLFYGFLITVVLKLTKHQKLDKKSIHFNIIPLLIMVALGLIFGIMNISLPEGLAQFSESFGSMAVPLILFCMGLSISIKSSLRSALPLLPFLVVRFVVWIAATAILFQLPWFDETSRKVLIINVMAPLGVSIMVISDMFGLDTDFIANSITISTLIFLFFLPFLFYFW